MNKDNKTVELDSECLDIISDYKQKGKLHPDFLPVTTYDMVQCGYPRSDHGEMIARDWDGTDGEGKLLPSNGMWCKVEDVKKLLLKHGLSLNAL
jgi:hypothetical protein